MQKWLLLDFDNTLMGTEDYALPSLIARFNDLYGAQIDEPLTLDIFKREFHSQAREVLCQNLSAYYAIEVDYEKLYEDREWNVMRHYQKAVGGIPIAKNLIETLSALKQQNYKMAMVSTNPVQRAMGALRYASCGRGDELVALIGSSFFEAGNKQKPMPDVYLYAIEQLETSPALCVAVEDSMRGTQAAVAAGITTFGYTGFADNAAEMAEKLRAAGCVKVFNDWAELPNLLQA